MALLDPATGAHAYTHDWLDGVATMLSPTGQVEVGYDYDPFGNPRDGPLSGGAEASATDGHSAGGHTGDVGGASADTFRKPLEGSSTRNPPTPRPTQAARKTNSDAPKPTATPKATAAAAAPENPLRYVGAYQDPNLGEGNYYLRARNYNPGSGRFTAVDPAPSDLAAISPYAYVNNNPLAHTDPTGARFMAYDGGSGAGGGVSPTPEPDPGPNLEEFGGPSPEELARAQQIQSKSWVDVILEAGGEILMEFLGVNDLLNCLNGDLGGCVSLVIGIVPWTKLFKAPQIAEAIFRAGKAVVKFTEELKCARAILKRAEDAARAAKEAAARAAREAAKREAAARAAARRAIKEAAEQAAAKARAVRLKAKKTGRDTGSSTPRNRPKSTGASKATGTVWDRIKPTQSNYPGSQLPRSFELHTDNVSVWVHGNATEHMAEYLAGKARRGASKASIDMATQAQLSSREAAVAEAARGGLPLDKLITVGDWELKFGPPREAGMLPVLIHALYKG